MWVPRINIHVKLNNSLVLHTSIFFFLNYLRTQSILHSRELLFVVDNLKRCPSIYNVSSSHRLWSAHIYEHIILEKYLPYPDHVAKNRLLIIRNAMPLQIIRHILLSHTHHIYCPSRISYHHHAHST